MSPLERRYRALLRLLPADHRAARGEELLGLLLDLDDGRRRPSVRQASGVLALALRLRFVHLGSLLLAALLVTVSTSTVGLLLGGLGSRMVVSYPHNAGLFWAVFAVVVLLRLVAAVAWILGSRIGALCCYAGVLGASIVIFGPLGFLRLDPVVVAPLVFAVWRRWPAPGGRVVLLAAFPVAAGLWAGSVFTTVGHNGNVVLLGITGVVTLLGVAGGGLRGRGTAVPLPARRSPRGTTG